MGTIFDWVEEVFVRIVWILWAVTRPFGLCPPSCNEGHTYKWPCRGRIKKPKKSSVGAWRDKVK